MKVLGIDPGTAITGYGVVERAANGALSLRECGVVRTERRAPLPERLCEIYRGVEELVGAHSPDVVAVEGVFFGKNVRTAVVLGHARGAILVAAAMRGIPVAEYPPAEIKNAIVGTGRATKDQVGFMVQRILKLRQPPRPDDAADGAAVAICHIFRATGVGSQAAAPFSLPALAKARGLA
ncbi:MAG TPA: crossover junction endodeoxyribonuclease RuvC [Longimicrobiaceae bacterium]|nr:crossover junction endodeoxyribonuclease RuvC [Longimicrobiaceae bacterium]